MLVGRDAERARIGALLEAAHASRSGALVIRGEPGIGKTALLEDARSEATGMSVLTARGLESESELPFAGLHQLVRPALHLLDELPRPQALALRGALGLADYRGDDRFLVSAACLTLLSELAEERPVLCLVDDAHWLDTPSSDALLFVARRVGAEGIAMLFATREGETRRFEARDLPELELGGLDAGSASSLLASRVEGELDAGVRALLVERARGNALALVELPGALTAAQLAGAEPLPDTLPLTRDVERLFLARVYRLPEPTQRLLLLLAADDSGTLAPVLAAAAMFGIHESAIDAAEHARLISVRGESVSFQHPLVRSAVYQSASSRERRAAHLTLAEALSSDLEADRRAWHRATAATGPDAEVAAELEAAALVARLRSGHSAAASALERAAELSVDRESRGRRLVDAASAAWHAGEPERATALADAADRMVDDPLLEAELAFVRGEVEFQCGALLAACETLLSGAAAVAPHDPAKALEMLFDAANAGENAGDVTRVAEALKRAASLPRSGDERESVLMDLLVGVGGLLEGTTAEGVPLVRDAVARADDFEEPIWLLWAAFGAGAIGDDAREAEFLRRAILLARESAAVDKLTRALLVSAVVGIFEGRYSVGAEVAEGLKLARDAGLRNTANFFLAIQAWLAGVQGHDDECREAASRVTEEARSTGMAVSNAIALWGVSLLDLARGRPEEAMSHLTALRVAPPGVGHPYIGLIFTPDLVEACVRSGRAEAAAEALKALEDFAQPAAPSWVRALAARCRALATEGGQREREFTEALKLHGESRRPFDRARTQLLYGQDLRRQRRRVEAREQLRPALEAFETLGAEPWAERARAELRASGETARKRDPSTIDQLTPQELQIARFVAEGLSNKEIAAQLFLSPRTIDYHLRHVFSKLGITSRTQLARLHLGEEEVVASARATVASS